MKMVACISYYVLYFITFATLIWFYWFLNFWFHCIDFIAASGAYIWGPSIQNYLNTDPEVQAFRKQAELAREIEKTIKTIEK